MKNNSKEALQSTDGMESEAIHTPLETILNVLKNTSLEISNAEIKNKETLKELALIVSNSDKFEAIDKDVISKKLGIVTVTYRRKRRNTDAASSETNLRPKCL